MGKIRIYELAKELHQDSKTIINQLNKLNVEVSNHMSTINQSDAEKIRTYFANMNHKQHEDNRSQKSDQILEQTPKVETSQEQKKELKKKSSRDHGKNNEEKTHTQKSEGSQKDGQRQNNSVKKQKNEATHRNAAAPHSDQNKVQNRRNKRNKKIKIFTQIMKKSLTIHPQKNQEMIETTAIILVKIKGKIRKIKKHNLIKKKFMILQKFNTMLS